MGTFQNINFKTSRLTGWRSLYVIGIPFCLQIYALSAAFLLPDVIFYTKLVVELVDWGAERPAWAKSDWSCGLWQVFVALNMVYMGQATW